MPVPPSGTGVCSRYALVRIVHDTEAFCCSLELFLCSNEEAGGVWTVGRRRTAVILFLFEGDHRV